MTAGDGPDALEAERHRELQREFGLDTVRIFLGVWSLYSALHVLGLVYSDALQYVDGRMARWSVAVNAGTFVAVVAFYLLNRRAERRSADAFAFFRRSFIALLALVLVVTLVHAHLAGTVSTIIVMALLLGSVAAQHALGTREAWIYLAASVAGLLLVVGMEYGELLPYAPLYRDGATLRPVALQLPNMAGMIVIYLVLSLIIVTSLDWSSHARIRAQQDLIAAHAALRTTERAMERLESLVPMCASCKKVRDEAGAWQDVEQFIVARTDSAVSHGLCPTCIARLYPELSD